LARIPGRWLTGLASANHVLADRASANTESADKAWPDTH